MDPRDRGSRSSLTITMAINPPNPSTLRYTQDFGEWWHRAHRYLMISRSVAKVRIRKGRAQGGPTMSDGFVSAVHFVDSHCMCARTAAGSGRRPSVTRNRLAQEYTV